MLQNKLLNLIATDPSGPPQSTTVRPTKHEGLILSANKQLAGKCRGGDTVRQADGSKIPNRGSSFLFWQENNMCTIEQIEMLIMPAEEVVDGVE